MDKEKLAALWQDKVADQISQTDAEELEKYLLENPAIAKEMQEMEQTWELFDEVERPEPSTQMDARFEGMLAAYKETKSKPIINPLDVLVSWLTKSWQVALTSLIIGLLAGWWLLPSQNQSKSIDELSSEIQTMKEMMMLTLIEQPKAQERIRAVNLAAELPSADEKVIHALIMTLNNDENLNVRLASLESLIRYANLPEVRSELVASLQTQDSPIMQVSIADALVVIQEKSSIEAMKSLKDNIEDELVKSKLEESIQTLTNI